MSDELDKLDVAGWVVRVRTERLGVGEALTVFYVAACPEPGDAEELVREARLLAYNEGVEALGTISRSTRDALRLRPGMVGLL